jgi:hypothetical protein
VVHGFRQEYQDRLNFVILDYDLDDDISLAREMGVAEHPAYAILDPNGGPDAVVRRIFGPQTIDGLRSVIEEAIASSEGP